MTLQFEEFFRLVKTKERFVICCHIHPDGDAVGSLLALGLVLKKMDKQVELICAEGVPGVYNFLEGSETINRNHDVNLPPQVLICVDCAEKERTAITPGIWNSAGLIIINIDHHITNTNFGHLNIVDPDAAATGEVIYRLLRYGEVPIDSRIATALYTAIATDSGFFRYANTSSFVLEVASQLVKEYRVEPAKVAEQVHEQKSYNSIRLLGEVLSKIQLATNGKVAWAVLDQAMLAKFPVENEETESYVNYARSIEGVEIGILFKELRPKEIKLSWRSSSAVDVSKLAGYFGGGGHARAAGCSINGPLETVVIEVLQFVANYYGAN